MTGPTRARPRTQPAARPQRWWRQALPATPTTPATTPQRALRRWMLGRTLRLSVFLSAVVLLRLALRWVGGLGRD